MTYLCKKSIMQNFTDFKLSKQLTKAIENLGFEKPTPIQSKSFKVIKSGKDMVGIAQTGTGKTLAYLLPIIEQIQYSDQVEPRVLILVPTRELVVQVEEEVKKLTKFKSIHSIGIYGGTNINTQKNSLQEGTDIVVATPGRVYDLILSGALSPKHIKKLVIDEVDVMLDLGFRYQLLNIMELLPEKRQNIMFSATMTDDVNLMINEYFITPKKVSVAVSGVPLDNIKQSAYNVPNFYTKVNLLKFLLNKEDEYNKVLVFISTKRQADTIFELLEEEFPNQGAVIHSNKTQNYRLRSINQFNNGDNRFLIATDIMARGLDIENISHVINFDTPKFTENYMHRIGRTGRAEKEGKSILFSTEKEILFKENIEKLMDFKIPTFRLPEDVEISKQLIREEQPTEKERENPIQLDFEKGAAFHEKSEKNKKVNLGGSYRREIAKKYKKPKTRGDKNYNKGKRRR
jgi:ATP-dependent RNA helicase RhlE